MNNKKDISVNFVKYEPYEHIPDLIAQLGKIHLSDAIQLLDAFDTSMITQNACIRSLALKLTDRTYFGPSPARFDRYRCLEINGMFYHNQSPQCGKQNCSLSEEDKIKRCARNLRAGKCRDEFIRKTLGATLFPQHYANEKQK